MRNDLIRDSIRSKASMRVFAEALGISKQSLYNKIQGVTEWSITELLEASRLLGWSVDEFLTIIEYNKTED